MVIDKHQVCIANTSFSPAVSMCAAHICILRPHPEDSCISAMFYICALGWSFPRKIKAKDEVGMGVFLVMELH